MNSLGLWTSKGGPILAEELSRGEYLLNLLGVRLKYFWQKGHKGTGHWLAKGNESADVIVKIGRDIDFHFMGPGL